MQQLHDGRQPPDAPASIFDDVELVSDRLRDAGIPDYLADALADWVLAGYSADTLAEQAHYLRRHIEPLLREVRS